MNSTAMRRNRAYAEWRERMERQRDADVVVWHVDLTDRPACVYCGTKTIDDGEVDVVNGEVVPACIACVRELGRFPNDTVEWRMERISWQLGKKR